MKVKRTEIVGAYSVIVEAEFDTTLASDSEYADKLFTVKRSRDLDLEEVKSEFPDMGDITGEDGTEVK